MQVASWELVAALAGIDQVLRERTGVEVIAFIDSEVALGTLLRGSSREPDWNALIGEVWLRAARGGHLLAAFRVPSAQNPADWPTRPLAKRLGIEQLESEGFSRTGWVWPADMPGLGRAGPERSA